MPLPILAPTNTVNANGQFKTNQYVRSEVVNQAKIILQSYGLNALKTGLYVITDQERLELEQQARDEGNKNKAYGLFGLPVFDVLTFAEKTYQTLDKETITVPEFTIGLALIEITQPKLIIKTPIQGRNTTVKEYISDGDYMITIRGVLASKGQNVAPEDQIKSLHAFCKIPETISVASNVLSRFGVTDIVIDEYNFFQDEGIRNLQRFEILASSDEPIEIKANRL